MVIAKPLLSHVEPFYIQSPHMEMQLLATLRPALSGRFLAISSFIAHFPPTLSKRGWCAVCSQQGREADCASNRIIIHEAAVRVGERCLNLCSHWVAPFKNKPNSRMTLATHEVFTRHRDTNRGKYACLLHPRWEEGRPLQVISTCSTQ